MFAGPNAPTFTAWLKDKARIINLLCEHGAGFLWEGWRKGSKVGDYALSVLSAHAKLWHRRSQPLGVTPDPCGQKPDHVSITATRRTGETAIRGA